MLTKGMLMIIIGISGVVITVILGIVLFTAMRKRELKFIDETVKSNGTPGSQRLNDAAGQKTDVVATESIYTNANGTDILHQSGKGTDVLVSENGARGTGTDILLPERKQVTSATGCLGVNGNRCDSE